MNSISIQKQRAGGADSYMLGISGDKREILGYLNGLFNMGIINLPRLQDPECKETGEFTETEELLDSENFAKVIVNRRKFIKIKSLHYEVDGEDLIHENRGRFGKKTREYLKKELNRIHFRALLKAAREFRKIPTMKFYGGKSSIEKVEPPPMPDFELSRISDKEPEGWEKKLRDTEKHWKFQ